jgi:hypothetical protein
MVRIGKRRHEEEGLGVVSRGVMVEPFAAFLGYVSGGIKLLRDRCSERLGTDVVVGQLVGLLAQRIGIRASRFQPDIILSAHVIPVPGAEIDVLEAVERKLHRESAAGLPALGMLLVIWSVAGSRLAGFRESRVEHHIPRARRRARENGRLAGEILQVAFADERGRIAGCA